MVVDPLSAIAEVEVEALVGILTSFFIPLFAIPSAGFGAWAMVVSQKTLEHDITNDHCRVHQMADYSKIVAIYTFISVGVTVAFAIFILVMSLVQLVVGIIPWVGYVWVYMKWAVGNFFMVGSMVLVYIAFVYGILGFVDGTKCGHIPGSASQADKDSFPYLWAFLLVNFIVNCVSALTTIPVFIGLVIALPLNAPGFLLFLLLFPIIVLVIVLVIVILVVLIVVLVLLCPFAVCCLCIASPTFRGFWGNTLKYKILGMERKSTRIQRDAYDVIEETTTLSYETVYGADM